MLGSYNIAEYPGYNISAELLAGVVGITGRRVVPSVDTKNPASSRSTIAP